MGNGIGNDRERGRTPFGTPSRPAVELADEADFGDNQSSLIIPSRLIRGAR